MSAFRRLFSLPSSGRLHFYPAKWCGYWSSPSLTVITRLLLFAASGEWVTMIIVCPRSLLIRCNKLIISAPVWLSRFPVGSSANRISGFPISARAIRVSVLYIARLLARIYFISGGVQNLQSDMVILQSFYACLFYRGASVCKDKLCSRATEN